MLEPLFTPANRAAWEYVDRDDSEAILRARLSAGLYRAINLAIESAFTYGIDFPIGAVALQGDRISGRGHANDIRFGQKHLHAETMALLDSRFSFGTVARTALADTLIVSLEPCDSCQKELSHVPGLTRVAFGLSRNDLADRGLINPHDSDIFTRSKERNYPYEITQIKDPALRTAGLTIFDHVTRDPQTGTVDVDMPALSAALEKLNSDKYP